MKYSFLAPIISCVLMVGPVDQGLCQNFSYWSEGSRDTPFFQPEIILKGIIKSNHRIPVSFKQKIKKAWDGYKMGGMPAPEYSEYKATIDVQRVLKGQIALKPLSFSFMRMMSAGYSEPLRPEPIEDGREVFVFLVQKAQPPEQYFEIGYRLPAPQKYNSQLHGIGTVILDELKAELPETAPPFDALVQMVIQELSTPRLSPAEWQAIRKKH